jgi:hypothetical protein
LKEPCVKFNGPPI